MTTVAEHSMSVRTPDGYRLFGDFVDVAGSTRVAVLGHGINSDRNEYLDMQRKLARRLAENGVSSVRFDFRGHGQSSGSSVEFSVISQMIDLQAVRDWIDRQWDARFRMPAYVGTSFGAAPGIIFGSTGRSFSSLTLFAPVLSYVRTFLRPETAWAGASFNAEGYRHAREHGYLLLDGEFRVGVQLLEQMHVIRPVDLLSSVAGEVLLIHGTADDSVPCAISRDAAECHSNVLASFIEGMGHGVYAVGDDRGTSAESRDMEKRVLDLIVEHVVGGGAPS